MKKFAILILYILVVLWLIMDIRVPTSSKVIYLMVCVPLVVILCIFLITNGNVLKKCNGKRKSLLNNRKRRKILRKMRKSYCPDMESNECPICMEVVVHDVEITKCKHVFHSKCLSEWSNSHDTCPCCRMLDYRLM